MNVILGMIYLITYLVFLYILFHREIHAVLNRNKTFSCKRCGHCCRFLVNLNDGDIKRLEKTGKTDFVRKVVGQNFIKRVNGYCPFLSLDSGIAKCKVYKDRPDVCRNFPNTKHLGIKGYDPMCCSFEPRWASKFE
jgi:Fe-S-cluster containining protein